MDNLLLHPSTKAAIEQSLQGSHHATALIGPYGAGKGFLAGKLAEELLGADHKPQQILRVTAEGTIGVELIRQLSSFLRLRTAGEETVRRVIIIEDAENLTIEAQNALLKTLEEPPGDTRIILTITEMNSLRQTIYSRLQIIHVQPCSSEQISDYFEAQGYEKQAIKKAYLISAGYLGLCYALLEDSDHALVAAISDAKLFLTSSAYERLTKVDALSKDKEKTALLLFAVKRVLNVATKAAKDETSISSITKRMKAVYSAEKSLKSNPNMKLLLTDLSLQL